MADAVTLLGLTARSLSTVELEGRLARRLHLARTYPTTTADLWDALTSPERIPRWFLPVSGDLREGGSYQLEGNAGGVVELCEPPHTFRITWVFGEGATSWVTCTVSEDGGGARLDLEQLGHVPDEMWQRYGPSATGIGWDMTLNGLGEHLETGKPNDAAAFVAWTASPAGMDYITQAGRAWAEVDTADGADGGEAEARAARTIAFYTGQEDAPT
jgi:uncharacterized protein YndB with AHSA1/START domain